MTSLQQDMLNACTSGDTTALQRLFGTANIEKGSRPVYISTPTDPPPTNALLEAAITAGNRNIVSFLLEFYDSIDINNRISFGKKAIAPLLQNPDLEILELLYNYDNRIINFEWDEHLATFLTAACKQPPEKMTPLLHFLIEHDVDLHTGGLPWEFAVHAAIAGDQQIDVIEAMIKKGGPVTYAAMR